MEKIYQTKFYNEGESKGDCLRACLETITGIKGLPHYTQIGPYDDILESNGFEIEQDDIQYLEIWDNMHNNVCIGVGDSSRGCKHAVIIDKDGNLIHDPHPSNEGIKSIDYCLVITKMQKG